MTEQRPPTRPTAWKWVGLALLVLAVPASVVLFGTWVLASVGSLGGRTDPAYAPAGMSFGLVLLGFLAGLAVWVTGCVLQRKPPPRRSRRAFVAATAVIAAALVLGAAVWAPYVWQVSRQDDLVAAVRSLDRRMPEGYRLTESSDVGSGGTGLAEPRREWTAPDGARPCEQLGPILTRWAGHEPKTAPKNEYGICSFDISRYGWQIVVRADADTGKVQLTTYA